MKSSQLKWSDLKVGILSLIALLIMVGIILKVGSNEKLFTNKYTLRTFVTNVQNLSEGALVSLSGIKVGTVKKLELTRFKGQNGVMVWLEIDQKVQDKITESSTARIMTLGILGDKYVDITQGQTGEAPLKDGDLLRGVIPLDVGEFTDKAAQTLDYLNAILASGKSIAHKMDQGQGLIGMLLNDPKFARQFSNLLQTTTRLLAALQSNQGSFGKLLNDSRLYENLVAITEDFNQISSQIATGQGTLGKLIAQPALYDNLESFTARADTLVNKLNNGGTTGRLLNDAQLYEEVAQLLNDMQALMQDMKANPRKYIHLKVF
ncbi:MAG: MCE family protein [Calditrichaeota bacterium]|nr:MAG: MCE family protein [Calditrichota bacterium]